MQSNPLIGAILDTSKVLIVDDLSVNRHMLLNFCKKAGFQHFAEAADGQEALDKILQWKPDLVFLDMQMPVMDGLELCVYLKEHQLIDSMVVIMQTIDPKIDFKVKAFEIGVTDLIEKPLDPHMTTARAIAHLERRYLRQQMEHDYRRIQAELREAVVLQNILLPSDELLAKVKSSAGHDIAHYYHPASELAGDYLSVRPLDDHRTAIISVDISGHGLTAALYAFSIHTLMQNESLANMEPGELLAILNDKLHVLMSPGKFATIFLAILHADKNEMHYAAAAAPSPVFFTSGTQRSLDTRGHPLGIKANSTYETHIVPYKKDDVLFLYSDALLETRAGSGKRMSEGELVDKISQSVDRSAAGIVKEVLVRFYTHYSRQPEDDLSILACKF
jgi:sigma-B regulation protein RsbU (phosphoserine phosphatase)